MSKTVTRAAGLDELVDRLQDVSRHIVAITASALAGFDKRSGVTFPGYRVLVLLASGRADTPSALALELGTSRPAVAQLLVRLEHEGLMLRKRDSADRRSFRLALTPRGSRLVSSVLAERARRLRPLLTHLTHRERRDLQRGLELLDEALSPGSR